MAHLFGVLPCAGSGPRQLCPSPTPPNDPRRVPLPRGLRLPLRWTVLHTVSRRFPWMISRLPGINGRSRNESLIKRQGLLPGLTSDRIQAVAFSRQVLWTQLPKPWLASGCSSTSVGASRSAWAIPRTIGKGRTQTRYRQTSPTVAYDINDGYGLHRTRVLSCGAVSSLRAGLPCWGRVVESVSIPCLSLFFCVFAS